MKQKGLLFFVLLISIFSIRVEAQILTSTPAFPTQTDQITIFYDATTGNGDLSGYTPIYAHTGVITSNSVGPNDWQHTVGNWGTADASVLMTPMGNNIHKIVITPSTFYNLNVGETVSKMMFVFRNATGSVVGRNADGSDIYLTVYPPGFNASLSQPTAESQIVNANQVVPVTANSSIASNITISVNGTQVASGNGITSLNYNFSESLSGEYIVSMTAVNGATTITDEKVIIILPSINVAAAPAGTIDGINITSTTGVRLQLYAPNKNFVFVIGDFNNWQLDLNYLMNRTPDGNTYWLDIPNLSPGTEYRFQYYINMEGMRVADVYAEKILDGWNDGWIPETTYPNLIDYPNGLTSEPVSVFRTDPPVFNWTDQSYVRPAKTKLVVYELLVRDFLEDRTYASLTDSLDYLENLGVTAIQLMPINEFEGNDSWGYNPSFYFAPDKAYGSGEALKTFVNEAHNRGIAVILDIALNHSFGQNPMVRMYFDASAGQYGQPTISNPWFNPTPKHDFNVGYDFNHESLQTKNFTKRVIGHWLQNYHIDGYRFDLSKGFTQNLTLGNIGAWGAYDQSRVNIWNDYYNHMQTVEPGSYAILEHFADNSEETVLSNSGMMFWGNLNHEYMEGSMGYPSNFSWGSYQNRGWNNAHLITYAESHDEERMMYKNLLYGASNGTYNITNLNTALKRQELAHCLLLPIPGPKMIWQFGELGYDYSINTCSDGVTINTDCRTAAKPVRWDYWDNQNRKHLYKVTAALNNLKKTEPIFSTTNFNIDLGGFGKRIHLNGTNNAVVVGNFQTTSLNMIPGFQHTGTWYDYFTGNAFQVNDLNASFFYEPGEYHIYTDYQLAVPDLNTSLEEVMSFAKSSFMIWPNPSNNRVNVAYSMVHAAPVQIVLRDLTGRVVSSFNTQGISGINQSEWNLSAENIAAGSYIISVETEGRRESAPFIWNP
ncbi:MAG: alpha-amylase family glycosyl hydrolase [Flavobacteriales bacterium]|nr:alpha-amylase family glycosyl hydrolase [Flavobacteriales bacterium]MDP4819025.1 alpha-amylase family glycosyl hydrolase [Flavobacteriales bacterium]